MLSASTLESEEVALLLEYVLGDGLPVQAVKMHRTIPMESVLMNTSFIRNQPMVSCYIHNHRGVCSSEYCTNNRIMQSGEGLAKAL